MSYFQRLCVQQSQFKGAQGEGQSRRRRRQGGGWRAGAGGVLARASDPGADRGSCRPFRTSGCGSNTRTVQFFTDNVVDIPVGNRDGRLRRASYSVHRQSDEHSSCSCETGTHGANCAENRGDFGGGCFLNMQLFQQFNSSDSVHR